MRYYYGSKEDPQLAVYERDGAYYPVFAEKYGTEPVTAPALQVIDDAETVFALDKYMRPYGEGRLKVYMAGPLFNEGDRYTNSLNSGALRAAGYTTFLPQEVVITNQSSELVKAACLYMDLKAIYACDCIVANCNGVEVDSGTAAEIGLGYGLGKRLLLYKSDVRNYYNETFRLNNFVGGLAGNKVYRSIGEILEALHGTEKNENGGSV